MGQFSLDKYKGVSYIYLNVNLPITGIGGVVTWQGAIELMFAGDRAVVVGTGNFLNPRATVEIIDGIKNYLESNNFLNVNQIVGLAWK